MEPDYLIDYEKHLFTHLFFAMISVFIFEPIFLFLFQILSFFNRFFLFLAF